MSEFSGGERPREMPPKERTRLTREDVLKRLEANEQFEGVDLVDVDLAGLNLESRSFRGSDLRGIKLFRKEKDPDGNSVEIRSSIGRADFTDVTFASVGDENDFRGVSAEGATFGYTENLGARRARQKSEYETSGKVPRDHDKGSLHGFNGTEGNFRNTRWANADFAGDGYGAEALFGGADFTGAVIVGGDLSNIDFSKTALTGIRIVEPISLSGMKITADQVSVIFEAIECTTEERQTQFAEMVGELGEIEALIEFFDIHIVSSRQV